MTSRELDVELQRQYTQQVRRISSALRTLADRIDREGQPSEASAHPCSSAAANVLHELHSGLANLPTWQLIVNAADSDAQSASRDRA